MNKNYINKPDVLKCYVYKILFIMRLTTIILFVSMLQVSASTLAQKITYVKKGVPLEQVFKEIKKQAGYNIIWNEKKVDVNMLIDANFRKSSIEEVLNKCFDNLPVSYTITDKMVMLKSAEPSFREKLADFLTAIEVRGRILDENNEPLVGAVIKIKGSTRTIATNDKGEFVLRGVDENAILVVSFLGYEAQEIKAAVNVGNVKLILNEDRLKEVEINAGYYTVKQRELTGSISKITAATIEKQPVNNPLMALQNRVPGLDIVQQTGIPGGGFTVRIRGQNSITSGLDPLYIVDGVLYPSIKLNTANSDVIYPSGSNPLSMINPNDIESIEVLKDADATSIYGSRGANGVILITTKKGLIGKIKVNANISQGFSQVGKKLDLLNTKQYIEMRMEALKNDGLEPSSTDYDVNGTWDINKYTDWQKEQIGGTAQITNTSLSVSGGNNYSRYLVSANYYGEGTVFQGDFGFKRAGLHNSLQFGSAESRFKSNLTTSYSHTISNLLQNDPTASISRAPNAPDYYDQYGQINWANNIALSNPAAALLNTQDANTDNLVGNIDFSYRILKDLTLQGSFGYNTIKREELDRLPNAARNPGTNPTSANRSSFFGNSSNISWITEPKIAYNTRIGKGILNSLLGMSFQKNTSEYRSINATNFGSDKVMDNISSASVFSVKQSDYTTYKYAAIFSRLNYSIAEKYYVNITARRDGSSKFGPGKQFANFGAIGVAWIFSEEKVIKDRFSFLTFGKLRGSYGLTGNDQIRDYQYLQLFTSAASYQGVPTFIRARIANPDYAWETTKKAEISMQLGFLRDKINIQISYYRNRSNNQLTPLPLPPSVGSDGIIANIPAILQNTGLEFEGQVKWITKKNWSWSTNFNLSIPKNKLVAYNNFASSAFSNQYILGKPLGIKKYYNTVVDQQSGQYVFEDKDNNGAMNDADRYLNKFLGRFFYGGIQNSVHYNQFDINFLISFVKQNGNSITAGLNNPGLFTGRSGLTNQPTVVLERWQAPGDISNIKRFSTLSSGNINYFLGNSDGSQSIADDSFIRLKNVAINYTLPQKWLSKIQVNGLDLFVQGQNILTLSKYKGLDPESQQNSLKLPPLRTISLGLRLTL